MGTKSAWTPERRAKQREIIARTKPWERSTGPRTAKGKARSSQNARMSPALADAQRQLDEIRLAALQMFGRQRWPKTVSPSKRT